MPSGDIPDADVAAWIEAQPRHLTFSEMAAACLIQFGADRALSADALRAYWAGAHPSITRSRIDRDRELVAFLRDRAGRATGPELLAECRARFAPARIPSRSALHRWVQRERIRQRADAGSVAPTAAG